MQCIWTSTSNVLRTPIWRASAGRTYAALNKARTQHWRGLSFGSIISRDVEDTKNAKAKLSSLAQVFVSTAIRDTSIPPAPLPIASATSESLDSSSSEASSLEQTKTSSSSKSGGTPTHTPAELSRISAQSVRIACSSPSSQDAFLIVKSLQLSVDHYKNGHYSHASFARKVAIDYGQAISPRLAIHALLHGLIRRGMTRKAGNVAQKILLHNKDVVISDRTLRAITTALCHTDMNALRTDSDFREQVQHLKASVGDYLARPRNLQGNLKVKLPCTRLAIDMFFAAQGYRKQRAKQMFQQLIDACLLQGEIIVVSFLFAFLVKQWYGRLFGSDMANDSIPEQELLKIGTEGASNKSMPLFPKEAFMSQTLSFINSVVFDTVPPDPHAIKPSYEEAAQALAVLAGMLHEGLLLHSQITGLVSTLTAFPSSSSVEVWTLRKGKKGKWERRNAREYFDEVLDDLVTKVTRAYYGRQGNRNAYAGVRTFNSLLHYSLRRSGSIEVADRVVRRMQKIGGNVAPNVTTFNIVLRAGTLLRRNDIAGKALKVLKERAENESHPITLAPSQKRSTKDEEGKTREGSTTSIARIPTIEEPEASGALAARPKTSHDSPSLSSPHIPDHILAQLPSSIQNIFLGDFDPDNLIPSDSSSPLYANGSTLSTFIDYLTASGHPEVVVILIKILIPELKVASYPPNSVDAQRLGPKRKPFNKPRAVARALGLGPQFFTSALNAIMKEGKTGLAERVWRLAKVAEKSSWMPESQTVPWVLPSAAYTVMMQCYAMEARKGLERQYVPVTKERDGLRTPLGWAASVATRRRKIGQSLNTYEISREVGVHLFRSMMLDGRHIPELMIDYLARGGVLPDLRTMQIPVPDERFFNAALDLFGHSPSSYTITKSVKSPASRWRRMERRQMDLFIERGQAPALQDVDLVTVVRAMYAAGYEVPIAYKHILAGVRISPLDELYKHPRRKASLRYHRPSTLHSTHHLPTVKHRGLPISNSLKVGKGRTYSIVSATSM